MNPATTPPEQKGCPAPGGDEPGFILVGVVMFMLALTILGLSLFALSSYEAQFFYASTSREQSLQSSQSGMELVKALLADTTARLEYAHRAEGEFGVTQALAYQQRSGNPTDTTSRGRVNPDSTLFIVVSARIGNEERTVRSRFIPQAAENPYHKLISAGMGIQYSTLNSTNQTMQLLGAVWQHVQSAADTAWTGQVDWRTGRPLDPSQPALPSANAFVDAALVAPDSSANFDLATHNGYFITFKNTDPAGKPKFYESPPALGNQDNDPAFDQYGFYCDEGIKLNIQGTVVWVVDDGVCFNHLVEVIDNNSKDGVLVIVAKANGTAKGSDPGHENRGIWFKGGIRLANSAHTKVFLVSEGDISLTYLNDSGVSNDVKALSIVTGGGVELMGPDTGHLTVLRYLSGTQALADRLLSEGALPPISGSRGTTYDYAWHSWVETRLP